MFQFQGFTEKANKALNLAVQSAEQFGHSYVSDSCRRAAAWHMQR